MEDEKSIISKLNDMLGDYQSISISKYRFWVHLDRCTLDQVTNIDPSLLSNAIVKCNRKFDIAIQLIRTMLDERLWFLARLREEESQIIDFVDSVRNQSQSYQPEDNARIGEQVCSGNL
jgi:hypothetical protein